MKNLFLERFHNKKRQFEVLIQHAATVMEWDNVEMKSLRDKNYFIPRHKGKVTLAWRHPRFDRISPASDVIKYLNVSQWIGCTLKGDMTKQQVVSPAHKMVFARINSWAVNEIEEKLAGKLVLRLCINIYSISTQKIGQIWTVFVYEPPINVDVESKQKKKSSRVRHAKFSELLGGFREKTVNCKLP